MIRGAIMELVGRGSCRRGVNGATEGAEGVKREWYWCGLERELNIIL